MVIELHHISKKYRSWIFKSVDYQFDPDRIYGIVGRNGSGKSTLLKIISGYTTPTKGQVRFIDQGKDLQADEWPMQIGYAAPYIGLIEELTVREQVEFHRRFKDFHNNLSPDEFLRLAGMEAHQDKFLNQLSSGLMQRLKLALHILTDTPVLLLDEPTSYLDAASREWFERLLANYGQNRLVILATNDIQDQLLCAQTLDVEAFLP